MTTAVVYGRFQPFHNGHLELLRLVMNDDKYDSCVVFIRTDDGTNEGNPFPADDIAQVIEKCLRRMFHRKDWAIVWGSTRLLTGNRLFTNGKARDELEIVGGNEEVNDYLRDHHPIRVMKSDIPVSGTEVRKAVKAQDSRVQHLVPQETYLYLLGAFYGMWNPHEPAGE